MKKLITVVMVIMLSSCVCDAKISSHESQNNTKDEFQGRCEYTEAMKLLEQLSSFGISIGSSDN